MPTDAVFPKPNDIILSGQRVRVWTGGDGPVLLLLHSAWGDAALSWEPVWSEFSRSFTVIAPDLPGFGRTHPFSEPSLAANAQLLYELLDSRRAESAVILGNSFGAAVAIEFAATFPDRTGRLVLVNGGFLPALPKFIKRMLNLPLLEKRFRAIMRSMTYSDKALARAFPNPEKLPQSFFERIRANEEQQSRIVFDTFRNQVNPQQTPAVPVAIVWGTGDRLASMKQAGLVRAWPSAPDYVSMAGAGHMPQVEAPGEFVKAVTDVARKRGGELEAGSPRSV